MSKNKKEIPMWAKTGHSKPVTRREFLSAGLLPFAASIVVPNWASLLLGNTANAQTAADCPIPLPLIPFVTLNLSGGASLSSNYLPMNQDRQLLSTYRKLGLGDNQIPVEREFGNAPFAGGGLSKLLIGLRARANAATLANTAFIGIPCRSVNDTYLNKLDITGLITKAGLVGGSMPNLTNSDFGYGLFQTPALVAPPTPLRVTNFANLADSIGYTGTLGSSLNRSQKNSLTKLLSSFTSSQTRKLAATQGGDNIKKVLDCAGIKNIETVNNGASTIDPRLNAAYAQAWGISAGTSGNDRNLVFGSMVYNTLIGNAGTTCLEMGGYDYHDNTRTTGDRQDQEAGDVIGRILQGAAAAQKPLMLYVISDGANVCPDSEARDVPWTSDLETSGMSYLLYYDPKGRPQTSDFQLGHFTNEGNADEKFITGVSPEVSAAAVFANWCQANKRIDLFEKIAGRSIDVSNLSKVLIVA